MHFFEMLSLLVAREWRDTLAADGAYRIAETSRQSLNGAGCTHVDKPETDTAPELYLLRSPLICITAIVLILFEPKHRNRKLESQFLIVGDM